MSLDFLHLLPEIYGIYMVMSQNVLFTQRTNHIEASYLLVKDKINNNDLEVKHISTDVMWSDVWNKPKQGTPFTVFRSACLC